MSNFKMTSVEKVEIARDGVLVKDSNGKDIIVDVKYTTSWFINEDTTLEEKEDLFLSNTKKATALLDRLKSEKELTTTPNAKVTKKEPKKSFWKEKPTEPKVEDTAPKFESTKKRGLSW